MVGMMKKYTSGMGGKNGQLQMKRNCMINYLKFVWNILAEKRKIRSEINDGRGGFVLKNRRRGEVESGWIYETEEYTSQVRI